MAEKRKKRKRKGKTGAVSSSATAHSAPQTGGVLQSIRSGFRRAAGAEEGKEESTVSKVIWTLILVAAIAFAATRWLGLWGEEEPAANSDDDSAETQDRAPAKTTPPRSPEKSDQGDQE